MQGNCKRGIGKYRFDNGDLYAGEWDVPKGAPVFVGSDGKAVQTNRGLLHGVGTYTWANGDTFAGTFNKGIKAGHGVFVEAGTHDRYEGEWRNDVAHGSGQFLQGRGDERYVGAWSNGVREGRGVESHVIREGEELFKTQYAGSFEGGHATGLGVSTRIDGTVYVCFTFPVIADGPELSLQSTRFLTSALFGYGIADTPAHMRLVSEVGQGRLHFRTAWYLQECTGRTSAMAAGDRPALVRRHTMQLGTTTTLSHSASKSDAASGRY